MEKASAFATVFVSYDEKAENTSPAVRGYRDGGFMDSKKHYCDSLVREITDELKFDFIRQEPRYRSLTDGITENSRL